MKLLRYQIKGKLKTLLLLFIPLIYSIEIASINFWMSYGYSEDKLNDFLITNVITALSIILSINCSLATILHFEYNRQIEKIIERVDLTKYSKEDIGAIYDNSKREIKHNIVLLITIFALSMLCIFFQKVLSDQKVISYVVDGLITYFLMISSIAFYEITCNGSLKVKPLI